jgi:hypothetical protein
VGRTAKSGVVVHSNNPNIQEAAAGWKFLGQPELHSATLPQKAKKNGSLANLSKNKI